MADLGAMQGDPRFCSPSTAPDNGYYDPGASGGSYPGKVAGSNACCSYEQSCSGCRGPSGPTGPSKPKVDSWDITKVQYGNAGVDPTTGKVKATSAQGTKDSETRGSTSNITSTDYSWVDGVTEEEAPTENVSRTATYGVNVDADDVKKKNQNTTGFSRTAASAEGGENTSLPSIGLPNVFEGTLPTSPEKPDFNLETGTVEANKHWANPTGQVSDWSSALNKGTNVEQTPKTKDVSKEAVENNNTLAPTLNLIESVVRGDFGNGAERYEALAEAGYDPQEVQTLVNQYLEGNYAGDTNAMQDQIKDLGNNPIDFSDTDTFQIGAKADKKKQALNGVFADFEDSEIDDRSALQKVKDFGGALLDKGKEFLNYLTSDEATHLGTDIMQGITNLVEGLVSPDKEYVEIGGKKYKYNDKSPEQQSVYMASEETSKVFQDQNLSTNDALLFTQNAFMMEDAANDKDSWDVLQKLVGSGLRGTNVKGMQEVTQATTTEVANYWSQDRINQLSPEEKSVLAESIVMSSVASGLSNNARIILNRLDASGVDVVGLNEAYKQARIDYKNSDAVAKAGDIVNNITYAAALTKAATKVAGKVKLNNAVKASNYIDEFNTIDTKGQLLTQEKNTLKMQENLYRQFGDTAKANEIANQIKTIDKQLDNIGDFVTKGFDKLEKAQSTVDKFTAPDHAKTSLANAQAILNELPNVDSIPDDIKTGIIEPGLSKNISRLDKISKLQDIATAMGGATAVGNALAEAGKVTGTTTAAEIASSQATPNQTSSDLYQASQQASDDIASATLTYDKDREEGPKEIARPTVYFTDLDKRLDAIDVNDYQNAAVEVNSILSEAATTGNNILRQYTDEFLKNGGQLQDLYDTKEYKQFTQDVYNLAQRSYDKAMQIKELTDSYGLDKYDNASKRQIQKDVATITEAMNAMTGNSMTEMTKEQVDAFYRYTRDMQSTVDASIALMKSAAFNGAQDSQGDKWSEAWKDDAAMKQSFWEKGNDKNTLSAKDWLSASVKGVGYTLLTVVGGALCANPATAVIGGILIAAGIKGGSQIGANMAMDITRAHSTNREALFGAEGAQGVILDIYNRTNEKANYGDKRSIGTYVNAGSGAMNIITGLTSMVENPAAGIGQIADGVAALTDLSGGLDQNLDTAVKNIYDLGKDIIEMADLDMDISDYMRNPYQNDDYLFDDTNKGQATKQINAPGIKQQYAGVNKQVAEAGYGSAEVQDTGVDVDAKYSGAREQAKNSNVATDYNAGMESEVNEAVSDEAVKKFITSVYRSEPDFIRKAIGKVLAAHSEREW